MTKYIIFILALVAYGYVSNDDYNQQKRIQESGSQIYK